MNSNESQVTIEVFQPEINSQIKRTTLEELREWIKDGKLQPNHQVRVKNLSWVEAHKIPAFQVLFESKRKEQTEQLKPSFNQTSTVAPALVKPQTVEEKPFPKPKFFSLKKEANSSDKEKSADETPAEPSVVFRAFEKKFLVKDKKSKTKNESVEPQKKFPFRKKNSSAAKNKKSFSHNKELILKRIFVFVAGCLLAGLLSYGGSYLWVYQLKTPAQIDEKSLPEISTLEDKLTSDKLGLRLKEETRKKELKESGEQESPAQHQDISQQIAQLEKQFDAARRAVIENQKIRLQEADFNTTFSFSLAVLLAAFVLTGVFYGKNPHTIEDKNSVKSDSEVDDEQSANEHKPHEEQTKAEKDEAENETLIEPDSTDFQNQTESFSKIIYVSENTVESVNTAENVKEETPQSSIQCYQHRDRSPGFYCDICENYFCADCTKTVSESGSHCPYCRLTCKPVEIRIGNDSSAKFAPEENKNPSLLELGKDSNFVVYDYPDERTRKLGIIPAFIIAALFSASISIFWVYKISPYLENRNQEVSQNVSPNAVKDSETPNAKPTETLSLTIKNNETSAADEPCIDPTTKKTFECDDETRNALYEQNRKIKSVEDAQKKVAEKSAVIAPSENSPAENAAQTGQQPNADESAKKALEKQQLIKTFGICFVMIFGLLLSTRLFHKEKKLTAGLKTRL